MQRPVIQTDEPVGSEKSLKAGEMFFVREVTQAEQVMRDWPQEIEGQGCGVCEGKNLGKCQMLAINTRHDEPTWKKIFV